MTNSAVRKNFENFANEIYMSDTTGDNFIENTTYTTNLSSMLSRLKLLSGRTRPFWRRGFYEGAITESPSAAGFSVKIVESSGKQCHISYQLPQNIIVNMDLVAIKRVD